MLRIMLLVVALLAVAAVLWSTWQVNRKLFTPALLLVTVALGLFATGVWQSGEEARVEVNPADILINVDDAIGMEEGIRLRGWVQNRSKAPLSHLEGRAQRLDCRDIEDSRRCETVAEAPFTLRRHVPAGAQYTWSAIIRMNEADRTRGNDWQIKVDQVTGFHQQRD